MGHISDTSYINKKALLAIMSMDSYFEIHHFPKSMMHAQDICACNPTATEIHAISHCITTLSPDCLQNKIYTSTKKSYAHQRYSDEDDKDESNKETRRLLFESLAPRRNSSVAENLSRTDLIAWWTELTRDWHTSVFSKFCS